MKKHFVKIFPVAILVVLAFAACTPPTAAPLDTTKVITVFSFTSPAVTGTITESAKTIAALVPFGTNVKDLAATFSYTGLKVTVGSVIQISGWTSNDFTNPVVYKVTAADSSTVNYTVTVTIASSDVKQITDFGFMSLSPPVSADVTESAKAIAVTVPFSTNVTALVATFTTTGASVTVGGIAQVSGSTANDFTNPVVYHVIAIDSSSTDYTVTVTKAAPSSTKVITTFSITSPAATGAINQTTKTISVTVPYGTTVTALVASFSYTGTGVTILGTPQVSGSTANDFTGTVTYTVSAEDSSTVDYMVTVTIAPVSTAKAITSFSITSPAAAGTINEGAMTIAVTVPGGTIVTSLVAAFTLSPSASATVNSVLQTSGATSNDFSSPVVYRVTAQDLSTTDYTVTVTVASPLTTILYANFQSLPYGMTDNTETLTPYTATYALPLVKDTHCYGADITGKMLVNTTATPPSEKTDWSTGAFQCSNATASIGKIKIGSVAGPFTMIINWEPAVTGDATRKLRIVINNTEVYYSGDGTAQTCTYQYTGTGPANIEVYGYNGTQAAGIKIYDLWIKE